MKHLAWTIMFNISLTCYGQYRCPDPRKVAFDNMVKGTENSWPLIVANDIIVCINELDQNKVDTTATTTRMECQEAYSKFGNLAARGVLTFRTSQTFQKISLNEILKSRKRDIGGHPTMVAINGFLTTDNSLAISKNAIVAIDVLFKAVVGSKGIDPNVAVVNIWTTTKKHRRRAGSFPVPGL